MTQTDLMMETPRDMAGKLDAVSWGLFFTWLGIAFLTNVGWGVGLLGVGGIVLAEQMGRKYFGLSIQGFWLVTGAVFAAWGLWELLEIKPGGAFLPILFIVIGLWIVASALRRKPATR